jgi:hypothetical protein
VLEGDGQMFLEIVESRRVGAGFLAILRLTLLFRPCVFLMRFFFDGGGEVVLDLGSYFLRLVL